MKNQIEMIEQQGVENIRKSKFFQLNTSNIPHMEPRLMQAYMDTFCVTMMGFWNVSIIMQGILLETLVKEIIFAKEKKDFQNPFGPAIQRCADEGYLEDEEINFLKRFKDEIRNPYQHVDIKKIVGEKKIPTWIIPIEKGKEAELILKGIENFHKQKLGPSELKGYEDLRAVGIVLKGEKDRKLALPLFCQVEEFVRKISEKHFGA